MFAKAYRSSQGKWPTYIIESEQQTFEINHLGDRLVEAEAENYDAQKEKHEEPERCVDKKFVPEILKKKKINLQYFR